MLPMGKLYMKEGQKEGVYHPLCRRATFVLLINDKLLYYCFSFNKPALSVFYGMKNCYLCII